MLIKKVNNSRVLGVQLDENLSWEKQINHISSKITSGIGAIVEGKGIMLNKAL